MIYTTLKDIRKHKPCEDGWEMLLSSLGKTKADDEPLAMITILDSNGLDDALWCLQVLGLEYHKLIVGLACDYAERSLKYVLEGETRPAGCIRVTRLWIEGKATLEEVQVAEDAAAAAAGDAQRSAWVAAGAAQAAEKEWQAKRFREVMTQMGAMK